MNDNEQESRWVSGDGPINRRTANPQQRGASPAQDTVSPEAFARAERSQARSALGAGLAQQFMGAAGGYAVGLVPHHGAVNLGWLMLGLGSVALMAQVVLNRRRVVKPAPQRTDPEV